MTAPLSTESTTAPLAAALRRYFAAIASRNTPQPEPLRPAFEALEEEATRALPHADAMLRHYLERKSYEKALAYLEGGLPEHRP